MNVDINEAIGKKILSISGIVDRTGHIQTEITLEGGLKILAFSPIILSKTIETVHILMRSEE